MANTFDAATAAAAWIPEIWGQEGLLALEKNVILASVANRYYEGEFRKPGDTVNVPNALSFTANAKAAQTVVTLQDPAAANTQLVLNKHYEVSVAPEDIAMTLMNPERMASIANGALAAIADQIDADGIAEAANFTGSPVGTQGVSANVASVRLGRKRLVDANMPVNADALFVMGSQTDYDLQGQDLFVQAQQSGSSSVVENAQVGRKFGFTFLVDQNISRAGGGDKNLAFHKDALTFATAKLYAPPADLGVRSASVDKNGIGIRVTMAWSHSDLATQITYDVLYGWKAIRPTLGLYVYGA